MRASRRRARKTAWRRGGVEITLRTDSDEDVVLDIRTSDSPAQFAAYVRDEMKRVTETAKDNGIVIP